jgi:hypothetical protein
VTAMRRPCRPAADSGDRADSEDLRRLLVAAAAARRLAIEQLHARHHEKLRQPKLSEQVTDF